MKPWIVLVGVCALAGCGPREADVVGHYQGTPLVDQKDRDEAAKNPLSAFLVSYIADASLDLKKDHRFAMKMVVPLEGDWALKGDQIELRPDTIFGISGRSQTGPQVTVSVNQAGQLPKSDDGKIRLRVQRDGSLQILGSKSSPPKDSYTFKKA